MLSAYNMFNSGLIKCIRNARKLFVGFIINSRPLCTTISDSDYVKYMHSLWLEDSSKVHVSWDQYFSELTRPSNIYQEDEDMIYTYSNEKAAFRTYQSTSQYASIQDHYDLCKLIKAYQFRGHLLADLDPLQLVRGYNIKQNLIDRQNPIMKSLRVPTNLDSLYVIPPFSYIGGDTRELTLREILLRLDKAYCNKIGVEYIYLPLISQLEFVKQIFEYPGKMPELSSAERLRGLVSVYQAFLFENFLMKKWPSEKRFGIDGSEAVISALSCLIETGSDLGANRFIFGLAHRGRLNVLANLLGMDLIQIFAQFQPLEPDRDILGDVKYHLGTATARTHPVSGKKIHLSLVSNASHLESHSTILLGKASAEQLFFENNDKSKVWPIIIHGDAAFTGQGIVYETFHLSELKHFHTGGTVHVVINNQIGFTTNPYLSRSSEYCTSVSKINEAPVFHVNGDDLDAVLQVVKIAAMYRAKFSHDVVIDIIAYRRLGHNEVDEPMFTQPVMYKVIKTMTPVHLKYAEKLIKEKVTTQAEIDAFAKEYESKLETEYQKAVKETVLVTGVWIDSPWKGFFGSEKDPTKLPKTGVDKAILLKIGEAVSTPPKDFNLHKGLVRIFGQRKKNIESDIVDWACGESFAYGSLLEEGIYVRLSGQDVERGTFSHRHHVIHDQKVPNKRINLLQHVFSNQATYKLVNSSLSEYGVLGFEIGMSLVNPHSLIIWEAQFGDFVNSAQILIDQYLCSGEAKWIRQAGITVLLPHGMEGMGPEHSSARIERFLQLCSDDDTDIITDMSVQMKQCNWFICNPSTPANFFHLLRRQIKLNYRKPLIVFTPKFLLRHPKCISMISEFTPGTSFEPYKQDPVVKPSPDIKKLLLCSGKVYYELMDARASAKLNDKIAIGRLEQISPVPYNLIYEDATVHFPNARVFWVQEEHKNQGPWPYLVPRLNKVIGGVKGPISYIGRTVSASSATGYKSSHDKEKKTFLDLAMTI